MKKYKAIISDIDGTLTPVVPNALPSSFVTEAIKNSTKKGVVFSLASGRPYSLITYLIKHLQLTSPVISDNGAVITNGETGSVLWKSVLSTHEANKILKIIKTNYLTRVSTLTGGLENPKKIPNEAEVLKISIHDIPVPEAEMYITSVEKELKDVTIVKAASYKGDNHLDVYISNIEATKQHAVLKFAELLGISTKEIIGIGDGYNDFPLLMACGLKVAMGNAVEELKAIANYVAPSVEEDGIVDILNKYC